MSGPDGVLAAAARLDLAGLGSADLQRRVDQKFLVPVALLARLAPELVATHRLLEVGGATAFSYRSHYVDTPDLACFSAHRQGRRLRWKARTRLYADSGLCRFEVKLKTGRGDTDKHAVEVDGPDTGVRGPARALLERVLRERYGVQAPADLGESLVVDYRRSTLVASHADARLTVDWDLSFTAPDGSRAVLRHDLAVVETKSPDGRSPADLVLRAAGVRPVSVSKYAVGTVLTRPELGEQPWRPLVRQHFQRLDRAAVAA